VLTISPQNIDDDVLSLLADTKLQHLHLLQNCYTPNHLTISACGVKAWRNVKKTNPRLRVHLRMENLTDGEVVLQPEAPVHSITYCAPQTAILPRSHAYPVLPVENRQTYAGHRVSSVAQFQQHLPVYDHVVMEY